MNLKNVSRHLQVQLITFPFFLSHISYFTMTMTMDIVGRQSRRRASVPFAISISCIAFTTCGRFCHAFTMRPVSPLSAISGLRLYKNCDRIFCRPRSCIGSAATSENPPTDEDDFANSPFSQLYGNTLVSVETIASLNEQWKQQQNQQQQGEPPTSSPSKVVFVDGSWYHRPDPITNLPRNPTQDFISGPRLPSARYIDIDALATTYELFPNDNPMQLPHMMPPPTLFSLAMDAYNIRNEDHVVVYARRGALFTPRVWFLFHSMGHDPRRLHLMQGSLEDYVEVGGVVETGEYHHASNAMENQYTDCFHRGILSVTRLYQEYFTTTTIPRYNAGVPTAMNMCNKDYVLEALKNGDLENKNSVIIDTRGSGYTKKGHMPMAIHLPYSQIASPTNALVMQPVSVLKRLFEDRQIAYLDPTLKIILSCGSGV